MARLHILGELCGINDATCSKGVSLMQWVGVEGYILLRSLVIQATSVLFPVILFKLMESIDQCSPVKYIAFPFFLKNAMIYKPY